MMTFQPIIKSIILASKEEARDLGHYHINSNHVLIQLLEHDIWLRDYVKLNIGQFRNQIRNQNKLDSEFNPITPELENVLIKSIIESRLHSKEEVNTNHLFLSMLRQKNCLAFKVLYKHGIDYEQFQEKLILDNVIQRDDYNSKESKKLFNPIYRTIYNIKLSATSLLIKLGLVI